MLKSIKDSRSGAWKMIIGFYLLTFGICCLVGALCNGTEDCTHNGFWGHFGPMDYAPIGIAIVFIGFRIIEYFIHLPKNAKSWNKEWNEEIKMTFRQFQDIYNINPDKWSVKDNTYIIYTYYTDYDGNIIENKTWHSRTIKNAIYFNFFDWFRFVGWLKQKDRHEKREEKLDKQKKSNEAIAKMLLAVQQDINKAYEKLAEPDEKIPEPEPEPAKEYNISDTMISDNYKINGGSASYYQYYQKINDQYDLVINNHNQTYAYDKYNGTYTRIT